MDHPESGSQSRKVFFLYPHSVIRDELIAEIIRNEYEVYFIYDHVRLLRLLESYRDAIVFINIDEGQIEPEWEQYIRKLMSTQGLKGIGLGILTYYNKVELQQKYLMEIGIPCGYIRLSQGAKESSRIILKILEANEARGRRRYVRVSCGNEEGASFNMKFKDDMFHGQILDISSAGMACRLNKKADIMIRTILPDIQLNLKGIIAHVTGVIGAVRQGNEPVFVIMFDQKMRPGTAEKISGFVFKTLQSTINDEIRKIPSHS
jgi:hypothetical protein